MISSGLQCVLFANDLTKPSSLTSIIKSLESLKLDIGILVNNVGMLGPHWMPFTEMDEKVVNDIISVNMTCGTMLCHALLPEMVRKGRGAIINISSSCSAFPVPYLATYAATKHFIAAFTKAIAAENSNRFVLVNAYNINLAKRTFVNFSEQLQFLFRNL